MIQVHLFQTSGRNSQIPSPPNGLYKNSIHRGTAKPHNRRRIAGVLTRELGHLRLAPLRYARDPMQAGEHSLNILKGYRPVKQTLRRFLEPKRQAMGEELAKLLEAGFIIEIKHPDWLANLVMVPKKDKS